MKHLNITIKGRVQGVGFRYSALKSAQSFGIKGFVRNQPDGSVYIEAEAEQFALDLFLDWCKKSPSISRVDSVSFSESVLQGFTEFSVRH